MAPRRSTSRRIEPSLEGARASSGGQGDFRVERNDRVSGGGRSTASSKRSAASSSRKSGGGGGNGGGGRRGRKPRRGVFGMMRTLVYWCFVLGIWGALGVGGIVAYYAAQMPNASTWSIPDRPPNVRIVSVGGEVLGNRGATGGEQRGLSEISPYIPQAVMAIEDRRFQSHFGIDPIGLARAMVTNLVAGDVVQGGSTITQQLAKNLFLTPERTVERKVQEVLLALWLEHEFTKDQIMEMYLNRVYFGSGAYGVEAAARRYFDKTADEVTLAEAALLAGLLKAPSRLSPARDPQAAEERAQVVLQAMRDSGYVSDAEVTTAMTQSPTRAPSYWTGAEHYVADAVMDQLTEVIGAVETDLVVTTTIDSQLQDLAEDAVVDAISTRGGELAVTQGALVSLDATGAVRAMVGGYDYAKSQFNRVTDARRQPGSAFKPFVYASALEMGYGPYSVRQDAPIQIGNWSPENYDQKFHGPLTLAQALARSTNTIAAQLVMETGPENVVALANRLGIKSTLTPNASISLGTSEVTLQELTAAYAPMMNGGYKAEPYMIARVETLDGDLIYQRTATQPERVLDGDVAAMMNAMLAEVVRSGTGRNAQMSGWLPAGKTGTTQSFRDALFVGYTSNLVTGVWFGNDDGKSMNRVTGGGLPAETWQAFMSGAHRGVPAALRPGVRPDGVIDQGPGYGPVPPDGIGDIIAGQDDPSGWGIDILGGSARVTSPRINEGAPMPPASVGEGNWDAQPTGATQPRATTLLDLILGN